MRPRRGHSPDRAGSRRAQRTTHTRRHDTAERHYNQDVLDDLARSGLSGDDYDLLKIEYQPRCPMKCPGYVLPYFDLDGRPNGFHRIRHLGEPPKNFKTGKPQRYWQGRNTGVHAYLPPYPFPTGSSTHITWREIAINPNSSVYITEGEKKAAALTRLGRPCIGLGGVDNFKRKNSSELIDDLKQFDWNGREVTIVFDADEEGKVNRRVEDAERRLAKMLIAEGAKVSIIRLPQRAGEKTGLDDYLLTHTLEDFDSLERLPPAPPIPEALRQRIYTLDDLLQDAVYLRGQDAITLLSDPTITCTPPAFGRILAASKELTDSNIAPVPVTKSWLAHRSRMTAHGRTFAPGQPPICLDPDGQQAVNLWREIVHQSPKDWRNRSKPFVDHIRYLIPDEEDRDQFLLWLSHMIQRPGERAPWHVLMYTDKAQGIGRNWVAACLGRVVQPYAALHADISTLAGSDKGKGFNGSLSGKMFVCVDEIHASAFAKGGRRMMETLKSALTAEYRLLNPKYGKESKEFERSRVLILSNHMDALPLDEDDRRFLVIQNPSTPKSAEYYAGLYGLLGDPEFIASVWEYLKSSDLNAFVLGHPPVSSAKKAIIEATEPGHITRLRDLFENPPTTDRERASRTEPGEIPELVLYGQTKKQTGLDSQRELEDYQLQAALRALGGKKHDRRIRFAGVNERVWVLRNHNKWLNADPETIKNYFLKVVTDPYRVVPPWVPHPDYPER